MLAEYEKLMEFRIGSWNINGRSICEEWLLADNIDQVLKFLLGIKCAQLNFIDSLLVSLQIGLALLAHQTKITCDSKIVKLSGIPCYLTTLERILKKFFNQMVLAFGKSLTDITPINGEVKLQSRGVLFSTIHCLNRPRIEANHHIPSRSKNHR